MTKFSSIQWFNNKGHLFSSRALTHGLFWVSYYLMFSLIWMRPDTGLYASFLLEFLLLPARILCVYCVIYVLIPRHLLAKRFTLFFIQYLALLAVAATLQSLVITYFYQPIINAPNLTPFTPSQWVKNLMLINSTVIFLGFVSLLKKHLTLLEHENDKPKLEKIKIVADRRTHLIDTQSILYVSAMGNYVEVFLDNDKRIVTYSSLKAFQQKLPEGFLRIHKSHVVNLTHVDSFNTQEVVIAGTSLPRGNECSDEQLITLY
jgi:hypothetical protein